MTQDSKQHFESSVEANERVFVNPWEARAFALTVKLHEQGRFDWSEWSDYLADAIARASHIGDSGGESYYAAWLNALEKLLADKGMVDVEELLARQLDIRHPADH